MCTQRVFTVCQAQHCGTHTDHVIRETGTFCKGEMLTLPTSSLNQFQSRAPQATLRTAFLISMFGKGSVTQLLPLLQDLPYLQKVHIFLMSLTDRLCLPLQRHLWLSCTFRDLLGKFIKSVCLILEQCQKPLLLLHT